MRKIFITGVSGTGKTTIAEELKKSVRIIDVDCVPGLCSWVNNETGKEVDGANTANADNTFIDEHDYVCNIEKLEKTMNESDDLVVVFGSVGNNSKLLPLFDKVLLLQCPPEVLTERLRTRTTNDFGKDTAVQERILGWRIAFDKLMLDAGAIPVDATRPLEKVVAQVLEEIRSQVHEEPSIYIEDGRVKEFELPTQAPRERQKQVAKIALRGLTVLVLNPGSPP